MSENGNGSPKTYTPTRRAASIIVSEDSICPLLKRTFAQTPANEPVIRGFVPMGYQARNETEILEVL